MTENLRVAWDGLRANKLRSGLTMLGVIIGVAAVVSLMSIGQGATATITDQISSAGTNLLFVSPGAPGRGPVRGAPGSASTLTYEDAEAIADPAQVSGTTSVVAEYGRPAQIIFGGANSNVTVTGTEPEYQAALGLELAGGRFLEAKDIDRRGNVAILGHQVAEDLFGGFDPIGQKIKLAPGGAGAKHSLTVVGVLAEHGGSMLADPDSAVLVPISTAQLKLFEGRNPLGEPIVTRVTVAAASEDLAESVKAQITELLGRRHELLATEEADFNVLSQAEMLELANEVTGVLTLFLGAIAGISLFVGGIGIMNIMLVSVTERTREIGLRKAVGARRSDILAQFLLESVALSALGGLIGVLTGIGIAKLVDLSGLMRAVPSPWAILAALASALAVGLFFGLYPANRAARLSPMEALRYQ